MNCYIENLYYTFDDFWDAKRVFSKKFREEELCEGCKGKKRWCDECKKRWSDHSDMPYGVCEECGVLLSGSVLSHHCSLYATARHQGMTELLEEIKKGGPIDIDKHFNLKEKDANK